MAKRCAVCGGSGMAMGGGCIMTTCDACTEPKTVTKVVSKEEVKTKATQAAKMDKRSHTYKKAVKGIMDKAGVSEEEAKKLFDAEMDKL